VRETGRTEITVTIYGKLNSFLLMVALAHTLAAETDMAIGLVATAVKPTADAELRDK
jgi:hypothetical protein